MSDIVLRIQIEAERHRFITANSIASFLLLLLKYFRHNCFFQYIYLAQLISDANGALVLLKFVTEKFNTIKTDIPTVFKYIKT